MVEKELKISDYYIKNTPIQIEAQSTLNDLCQKTGFYYCFDNATASTVLENPLKEEIPLTGNYAFMLFVEKGNNENHVKQTLTQWTSGDTYIRMKTKASTWTNWKKIVTDDVITSMNSIITDITNNYINHNHDDRYYTEIELEENFLQKSDTVGVVKNDGTIAKIGVQPGWVAAGDHTHGSTYISQQSTDTGFVKSNGNIVGFGTESGKVSEGNHNHDATYLKKSETDGFVKNDGTIDYPASPLPFDDANIILTSKEFTKNHQNDELNGTIESERYKGCVVRYYDNDDSDNYINCSFYLKNTDYNLTKGSVITLSFWAKSNNMSLNPKITCYNLKKTGGLNSLVLKTEKSATNIGNSYGDGHCTFPLTENWKLYYVTWKYQSGQDAGSPDIDNNIIIRTLQHSNALICGVTLTKGSDVWFINENGINLKDNFIEKKSTDTGFVKSNGDIVDFGTTSGKVSEGNHTHDDRYYTETEINSTLSNYTQKTDINETYPSITDKINLIPNTKEFDNIYMYGGSQNTLNGTLLSEEYRGYKIREYDNSEGTTYVDCGFDGYPVVGTFDKGDVFTLSFWAKGSGEIQTLSAGPSGYIETKVINYEKTGYGVGNSYSNGLCKFNLTDEWKRYFVTWKFNPNSSSSLTNRKYTIIRFQSGTYGKLCGVMLTKGEYAWTPQENNIDNKFIEKTQEDNGFLKSNGNIVDFGNIEGTVASGGHIHSKYDISGINLIPYSYSFDSGEPQDTTKWQKQNDLLEGFTIRKGTTNDGEYYWNLEDITDYKPGDTFTLSFWAKGNMSSINCYLDGENNCIPSKVISYTTGAQNVSNNFGNGECSFNTTNDWTKYYITWKLQTNVSNESLSKNKTLKITADGVVYISALMFEKGEIVHNWAPCFNDFMKKTHDNEGLLASNGEIININNSQWERYLLQDRDPVNSTDESREDNKMYYYINRTLGLGHIKWLETGRTIKKDGEYFQCPILGIYPPVETYYLRSYGTNLNVMISQKTPRIKLIPDSGQQETGVWISATFPIKLSSTEITTWGIGDVDENGNEIENLHH